MIKQTTNVHIPLIAPLMHVCVCSSPGLLPLQAPFAIIKLQSHKEGGMGTIKMIRRLYQLEDRSSHLRVGRSQSKEWRGVEGGCGGVSVGVGSVGGPRLCLMLTESRE